VSYVLGISFLNSVSPLVYELLAEISYPVPEDIINGLCNQCNNIFGIIFYFTFRYGVIIELATKLGAKMDLD
jgi:hypothetical protein